MSDQRKIIFLHLPKTGGTSLVNILHQHYRLENSALLLGDDSENLKRVVQEGKSFIHGHFSTKLIDQTEVHSFFKACLFRDAADRVISRYVHLVNSEEARLKEEFANYTGFEDYLKSSYADNWQCRMLAGLWHEGRVDEQIFDQAKENLNKFDWVARMEDLPEAALDLSLKLGFSNYSKTHLNSRRSEQLWRELDFKHRDEIESLNIWDQKLIAIVGQRYQEKLAIPIMKQLKLKLKHLI